MDLTIIITARNRRSTLPRVIEYYKEFKGKVILLDESSKSWGDIAKYDYLEYIHLPDSNWMNSMCYALNQVQTKYVTVIPDDDFLMLNNIGNIIQFLEENPKYICATGQQIAMYDDGFQYETLEYLFELGSICSNDRLERMKFYWTNFHAKVHAVTSTQIQRDIYRFMVDHDNLCAIRIFDKLFSLFVSNAGKIKMLPVVQMVRSREKLTIDYSILSVAERLDPESKLLKHIKPNLTFESSFMDLDIDPLLEYLDISKNFLKEIHASLCDQKQKKQNYVNVCKNQDIICDVIDTPPQHGDYVYTALPEDRWVSEISQHSSKSKSNTNTYPIYKEDNIQEINNITYYAEKYPLTPHKEMLGQEYLNFLLKRINYDTHPPYQNIIVTGGLGHIGSFIIKNLPKGYSLTVVDNMATNKYNSLMNLNKNIRFIQSDFLDISEDLLKWADVIIHLAAITDAANPNNHDEIEIVNVGLTKLFIDKCIKHSNAKFIFPSSTSVYGVSSEYVTEDDDKFINPQSPYAESKIKIENYLKKSDINYTILRLGTIFGVSWGMRFHTAVNKFCYQAATGVPLTIWEQNYNQYRPYLGLVDLLKAIMLTFTSDTDKQIFNVITDNYKLSHIVDMIKNNKDVQLNMINTPLLNQYSYEVNIDKILKLGYYPNSNIHEEITNTIKLFDGVAGV